MGEKKCKNCKYCEVSYSSGLQPAMNNFGRYLCAYNNPEKIILLDINEILPSEELCNIDGNCSYYKPKLQIKLFNYVKHLVNK